MSHVVDYVISPKEGAVSVYDVSYIGSVWEKSEESGVPIVAP